MRSLAEGLNLRIEYKRKLPGAALRLLRQQAQGMNDTWSMDFVSDSLFNGQRFGVLTVVDDYSRECLALEVGQSIRGEQVTAVLNRGSYFGVQVQSDKVSRAVTKFSISMPDIGPRLPAEYAYD